MICFRLPLKMSSRISGNVYPSLKTTGLESVAASTSHNAVGLDGLVEG
jgi:hypothetical protein